MEHEKKMEKLSIKREKMILDPKRLILKTNDTF
jgi:hypothetical protein